ncbi:DUF2390 domain-containing protein [Saccharospirillum mangrovi]|uniref:DUF2390 domain-containing protein n=1 Tax=Saccharospirillum mangrovi TaxID=2161747 RepID=UPI000D3B9813|nr:DUF2390 domain-containing protein [Saccharospirillum mangrovi]
MSDYKAALWDFALAQYPHFKEPLLHWQHLGAGVNDLLLLGFAHQQRLNIEPAIWRRIDAGRPRTLLRRLRGFRFSLSKDNPVRPGILRWELEMERWDLALLSGCLVLHNQGIGSEQMLDVCCKQWHITKDPALNLLVQRLGLSAQ